MCAPAYRSPYKYLHMTSLLRNARTTSESTGKDQMRDRLADFQRRVVTDRFEEVELGPSTPAAVPYNLANALDGRLR
ncbi:hypothetical protein ANCDUO_01004 [Ancylostoma duodenale]|uniref:Uncharacterized protein n=1 Tax=Ancylostoma duodenale TaxID=51022 RepID=A0A0C2E010_9BILA|nr:hypothetical protein ANCDUO_01004 [Ancylostoma duodenale]